MADRGTTRSSSCSTISPALPSTPQSLRTPRSGSCSSRLPSRHRGGRPPDRVRGPRDSQVIPQRRCAACGRWCRRRFHGESTVDSSELRVGWQAGHPRGVRRGGIELCRHVGRCVLNLSTLTCQLSTAPMMMGPRYATGPLVPPTRYGRRRADAQPPGDAMRPRCRSQQRAVAAVNDQRRLEQRIAPIPVAHPAHTTRPWTCPAVCGFLGTGGETCHAQQRRDRRCRPSVSDC